MNVSADTDRLPQLRPVPRPGWPKIVQCLAKEADGTDCKHLVRATAPGQRLCARHRKKIGL